MGYKLLQSADPHFVDASNTEESKQLTKKLKIVKQHARNADYCDFTEGISDECLRVFNDIKTKNISTDEATATRLANQMRCLTAGFAAGLNPQEINDLPNKIEAIRDLAANGMLLPQDDDNQLIGNYLFTFGDQLKFRKQIAKISSLGLDPSTKAFEDALKRDVQDRSTMGVANKAISVAEINKQLVAVRAAAMIEKKDLIIDTEFNATEHFESLIAELKA